ncbi:MAG: SDR family NAD(P)-dependent oxidoreductase [Bryobacteraceae bacterium]
MTAAGAGAILATRGGARRTFEFRGSTVLITGGSRGLGLVLARQFAREGARLALCARNAGELAAAQQQLPGADVLSVPCDVTDQAQVEAMVQQVKSHFGQIDVLINNAGIMTVGPMENMTIDDYREAMDTNFWSAVYTSLAVIPEMQKKRAGRIVNICSIGGKIGVPHLLPYCASKFALGGFSQGLRAELRKDGILVTAIYPGLMRTGSPRNADFKGQHQAEYAWFSISDSIPGLSISAEQAAQEIVNATREGQAERILSVAAKMGVGVNSLLPEFTGELLGLANRLLPGPGGIGKERRKGHESESSLSPSIATVLTERAAERNNQLA